MMTENRDSYLYRSFNDQNWEKVGGPYNDEEAILVRDQQQRESEKHLRNTRRGFLFAVIKFEPGDEVPEEIQGSAQEILRRSRQTD